MSTADGFSTELPTAEKLALAEAETAREALRLKEKADAEKKALIDMLAKPSSISEEEALKRATAIRAQIVEFSGGAPSAIAITLKWA
jgi:hypothetical protein